MVEYIEISADQDPPCVQYNCAEDVADLDLTQGTSFRFLTAMEESKDSIGRSHGAAEETQSYLTPTNNSLEASSQERLWMVPRLKSSEELEPKQEDDFVSTSLFVHGDLDSHLFLVEQRKKATNLVESGVKAAAGQGATAPGYDRREDQGLGMLVVQRSANADNTVESSQLDLPVSTMPADVLHHDGKQDQVQGTPWVQKSRDGGRKMEDSEVDLLGSIMPKTPTAEEVARRDAEKKRSEDVRKPFFKIQKSDFLSQKIAKEIEEFTMTSSLGCSVSRPTHGSGDFWTNRTGGACEAKSTTEKNVVKGRGESINGMAPHGLVEKTGLSTEKKRKIMSAWHPEEKLAVLRTITNTMFLWEVEQSSSQQHYGSWPNSEITMSAAHAAKGSQRELFEFLETIEENMSRPLICCGAVCELLKAYPSEDLLPFMFLDDFFASESREAKDQCMSGRLTEGLSFDHLEVYQEGEHKKFWQTLVHHVVNVKDHNLASLTQIAEVFVEILLPSIRREVFPAQKAADLQRDLLQFLVGGFKSKTLQHFNADDEEDKGTAAQTRLQQVSQDSAGKNGSIDKDRTGIQIPLQQATGFSKGYIVKRSSHLRPVSARKGLLSCFGSRVQANFRIWRLKALSRGVDTVDDALVCLLRNNG